MQQRSAIGWITSGVASNRPIAMVHTIFGYESIHHEIEWTQSSTCHYSLSPGDPVEANGGSGDVARFDRWRQKAWYGLTSR
jgi:hypothetical protein